MLMVCVGGQIFQGEKFCIKHDPGATPLVVNWRPFGGCELKVEEQKWDRWVAYGVANEEERGYIR